ncbi:MAG: iron-sulfur cluster repair di-iron protein [Acidobacteriota bacterium]
MNNIAEKTIREIALEAPATTRVFEEFKIDYCCGGRRSIADACATAGLDPAALTERINVVMNAAKTETDTDHPEDKKPTELIGYILAKHHIFTVQEINRLIPIMEKVISRHGDNHPELHDLGSVFEDLCNSLLPHMQKEENVLFPYIQTLEASIEQGLPIGQPHFGTVQNPIRMMMAEHDIDGERLERMRSITSDYLLPDGACPTYTALFAGMQDLERDLHRHIHLENNVLFPAAAKLEDESR